MGKIFYLMGKSSCGKDTIFKLLIQNQKLNLKTVVMYTTRPIREGETNGVEYFFVEEAELQKIEETGQLVELRAYDTMHGIWKYFTVNDKQIQLDNTFYLMIGTLESYQKMKQYYGEETMIPIYIELEDGLRLERALQRERQQAIPKYNELCRRFLADSIDFSEENIKRAGIDRSFKNEDLVSCVKEIEEYIIENC